MQVRAGRSEFAGLRLAGSSAVAPLQHKAVRATQRSVRRRS